MRHRARADLSGGTGATRLPTAPGPGVEEMVADNGYHSDETLVGLHEGRGSESRIGAGAFLAICRLIGRLIDRWARLKRAWGFKWTPKALVGSFTRRQAA